MTRIRSSTLFLIVAVLTLLVAGAARSAPVILLAEEAVPGSQEISEEPTLQQEVPVVDHTSEATPVQPDPQPADPPEQHDQPPAEHEQAPEPEPAPQPSQQ